MIWKQKQLKSKKSKKSANSVEIKDDPKIEETADIAETVISESNAETVNKKEESAQEPSVSNPDEFRRISQNPIPAESTNLEVMKEGEKIDNEETAPLESENTDIIKKIKETELTKGLNCEEVSKYVSIETKDEINSTETCEEKTSPAIEKKFRRGKRESQ